MTDFSCKTCKLKVEIDGAKDYYCEKLGMHVGSDFFCAHYESCPQAIMVKIPKTNYSLKVGLNNSDRLEIIVRENGVDYIEIECSVNDGGVLVGHRIIGVEV